MGGFVGVGETRANRMHRLADANTEIALDGFVERWSELLAFEPEERRQKMVAIDEGRTVAGAYPFDGNDLLSRLAFQAAGSVDRTGNLLEAQHDRAGFDAAQPHLLGEA